MNVSAFCESYFNGFQEISNCRKTSYTVSALAALKILSYFTVVIPLTFAAIYSAASLYGRVKTLIQFSKNPAKNRFEEAKAIKNAYFEERRNQAKKIFEEAKAKAGSDMKGTSSEATRIRDAQIEDAQIKYNLSLEEADAHAKLLESLH